MWKSKLKCECGCGVDSMVNQRREVSRGAIWPVKAVMGRHDGVHHGSQKRKTGGRSIWSKSRWNWRYKHDTRWWDRFTNCCNNRVLTPAIFIFNLHTSTHALSTRGPIFPFPFPPLLNVLPTPPNHKQCRWEQYFQILYVPQAFESFSRVFDSWIAYLGLRQD